MTATRPRVQRADYTDAAVVERVYALLDTSFPTLSERIRLADRAGARWQEVSAPFVAWAGHVAVAHAGVIPIPMLVGGERRAVAGVHAVCTRPEWRGRGCARAVLEAALAYVDDHFDAAILTTAIPAMYELFGFRVIEEHTFVARAATAARRPGSLRRLALDSADDVALLARLLPDRAPVSNALAAVDPGWLFLIDEVLASRGLGRLFHAPRLDAVLALERSAGSVRLLDIATRSMPSFDDVVHEIGGGYDQLELRFTPDVLGGGPYDARPHDPFDRLMARGVFDTGVERVALSPLARC